MGGIGDLLMLHRLPAEGPDDPDAPQPLAHQLILPINVGVRLLPQGEDLPADEDDDDKDQGHCAQNDAGQDGIHLEGENNASQEHGGDGDDTAG